MARRIEVNDFGSEATGYGRRRRTRRSVDASRTVWIDSELQSGRWEQRDPVTSETTSGESVWCCRTMIGTSIFVLEGTRAELQELLLPRDCPHARQLGYALKVTHGTYVLEGEICGDQELAAGEPKFHLDPRRLATNEGWHLHRQPGDSSSRYTILLRGEPEPRFVLQRLEKHPEPHVPDKWVDVSASLEGLQAGGKLRPKP